MHKLLNMFRPSPLVPLQRGKILLHTYLYNRQDTISLKFIQQSKLQNQLAVAEERKRYALCTMRHALSTNQ
jgi:hypothetical protein